jgi:hypothetical protein
MISPLKREESQEGKAKEQPFYTKVYMLKRGERMRHVSIFLLAAGVLNRIFSTFEELSYDFHQLNMIFTCTIQFSYAFRQFSVEGYP